MVIIYDRRGHLGVTLLVIGVICISIAIVKEFKVIFNIDLTTSVLLGILGFGLLTLGYCMAYLRIPLRTLYFLILGIIGFSSLVFGFFLMIEGQILGDRTIPAAVASIIMGITCILIAGGAKAKKS